jgi:hypothetical protein
VQSSCEHGNEHSGSIKMLDIYRVAAQLMASRVVLSSTESVSSLGTKYFRNAGISECAHRSYRVCPQELQSVPTGAIECAHRSYRVCPQEL